MSRSLQRGGSFEGEEIGLFYNKLPVPGAGKRLVTWLHSIFYEHGCTGYTGFTGREVLAPEAGSGDDPVRACGCPGLQASRFLKNPVHPVHPCESIFLLSRPIPDAGNHRVSFAVPGGPFLTPFSFTRTRGGVAIEWVKNTVFLRVSSWVILFRRCFSRAGEARPAPQVNNSAATDLQLTRLLYSALLSGTRRRVGQTTAAGRSLFRRHGKFADGFIPQAPRRVRKRQQEL